jgi:hypothetical protein
MRSEYHKVKTMNSILFTWPMKRKKAFHRRSS